jgi:hypothetical protein
MLRSSLFVLSAGPAVLSAGMYRWRAVVPGSAVHGDNESSGGRQGLVVMRAAPVRVQPGPLTSAEEQLAGAVWRRGTGRPMSTVLQQG